MEVLVNAFLFENTPAVEETPVVARWKRKPHQLLRATPSGNMPPIDRNEEMSADELKLLRHNRPSKVQ